MTDDEWLAESNRNLEEMIALTVDEIAHWGSLRDTATSEHDRRWYQVQHDCAVRSREGLLEILARRAAAARTPRN